MGMGRTQGCTLADMCAQQPLCFGLLRKSSLEKGAGWQGAQRQTVAPTPVVMGQAAVPMAQPVMAQPVGAVAAHPVAAPGFIDQSVPAFARPQAQGHQGP